MRFPIKVNQSIVPRWLAPLLPVVHDPRNIIFASEDPQLFDAGIGSIKIDSTWKTTSAGRHPITDAAICEIAEGMSGATLIDVGASSGLTSVELIDRLGAAFSRYYVTDLYFSVPYHIENAITYFYHPLTKTCIIRSGGLCVIYADDGATPFGVVARQLLRRAPRRGPAEARLASLVHPKLTARMAADQRVTTELFSIFNPWHHGPVDIIKAANVLNKGYFSSTQLLSAIRNLRAALNPGGFLVVTDNREVEKISIFSRESAEELLLVKQINNGSEISKLIC